MIKTYRGLLADGAQDQIRLQTIKGKMGYRITKFQIFPSAPGTAATEPVVQVWKSEITTVPTSAATVNFTDSDLLAVAYYQDGDQVQYNDSSLIVFDQEIFNQDIYITHTNQEGSSSTNYYLELEVIPLDDAGAEYTTLKDMRSS